MKSRPFLKKLPSSIVDVRKSQNYQKENTGKLLSTASSVITMPLQWLLLLPPRLRVPKLFPPIHELPATITKIVVILVDRQSSSKRWPSNDPFRPPTLQFCLRVHQISASSFVETYELQECCALASWRQCRWGLRQ